MEAERSRDRRRDNAEITFFFFLKAVNLYRLSPTIQYVVKRKKNKGSNSRHCLRKSLSAPGLRKSADLIEVLWPRLLGEPKSEAPNKASIPTTTLRLQPRTWSPHGCIVSCLRFLLSHRPVRPTASISRFPLSPKAATIAELSTRRKSICLPLTHVAHPSPQVMVGPSCDWGGSRRRRRLTVVSRLKSSSRKKE